MVSFETAKLVRCFVCADPVIYLGPTALEGSKRLCSGICAVIDDQLTPGDWVEVEGPIRVER